MPKRLSPECVDLINKILETDPDKRLTTDQIKEHPWYQTYQPVCKSQGLIIGQNEIPIEPSLLRYLERYGFKKDYATQCLNRNKHNQVTTVYYLLQQRLVKQGKLPSAFKVQSTPTKKKTGSKTGDGIDEDKPIRDQEKKPTGNGKDEKGKESPSVSPNRRNRREDLTHFEEMVNRTSVPRKSHGKANKNQLDDSDRDHQNSR